MSCTLEFRVPDRCLRLTLCVPDRCLRLTLCVDDPAEVSRYVTDDGKIVYEDDLPVKTWGNP